MSPAKAPADLVFRKGLGVAVAVSALGQRQAGGAAAPPALGDFRFDGGPHSGSSEAARPAGGTATFWGSGIASRASTSSLRRAQTQAVRGVCAR